MKPPQSICAEEPVHRDRMAIDQTRPAARAEARMPSACSSCSGGRRYDYMSANCLSTTAVYAAGGGEEEEVSPSGHQSSLSDHLSPSNRTLRRPNRARLRTALGSLVRERFLVDKQPWGWGRASVKIRAIRERV